MNELSGIALLTSFAAGLISFLSPCVLPLVPGYVSYIAGQSLTESMTHVTRLRSVSLSAIFVLGFSTVFISLGASATALGQLLAAYRYQTNLIGGAVVILFGLLMIGLVGSPWLQREFRFNVALPGGRPLAGYALGAAFAFGWTPCIGPVLGTILTISAATASIPQGIILLAVYSAGLAVPFLATSLLADRLLVRLRRFRRTGRYLQIGAGAVTVGLGAAIVTNQLTVLSYWLLDTFPILARIG